MCIKPNLNIFWFRFSSEPILDNDRTTTKMLFTLKLVKDGTEKSSNYKAQDKSSISPLLDIVAKFDVIWYVTYTCRDWVAKAGRVAFDNFSFVGIGTR